MSEFTTIQITKDVKNQLEAIKSARGGKYNDVIKHLLDCSIGVDVNDVVTINREPTAFTLKFMRLNEPGRVKVVDVSYKMLRDFPVGSVFAAAEDVVGCDFVNGVAEILFKRGDDVVVLVKEVSCRDGVRSVDSSVVHVRLF